LKHNTVTKCKLSRAQTAFWKYWNPPMFY